EQARESMGSGLRGIIEGKQVSAGSRDMIFARQHTPEWALRAIRRGSWRSALVVFIAVEGRPIGALLLTDELRSDTRHAFSLLRRSLAKRSFLRLVALDPINGRASRRYQLTVRQNDRMPMYLKTVDFRTHMPPKAFYPRTQQGECRSLARRMAS